MAKATIKMPEEFLMKISKLGKQTDVIIPKVLAAGAEVVESKIKSNLADLIGKGKSGDNRSTGELISALGTSEARQDRDGNYNVKIGFAEPRRDGKSNAMIANILEYGKSGQPARPFLKPAKTKSQKACMQSMIDKLESEVDGL